MKSSSSVAALRPQMSGARRLLTGFCAAAVLAAATALAQPVPQAALSSTSEMLGSSVTLVASFTNSSTTPTDVGYGPYLDLLLPDSPDPLTFEGAGYLGQDLVPQVVQLDATGAGQHPFARAANGSPLPITGPPNGSLVVLTLPFGSVTTGQPSIEVDVRLGISQEAAPDAAIGVQVVPGFRYGSDALDNHASDPQIRGTTAAGSVTPQLARFTKRLGAPEGDTPVGATFTHRYELEIELATGQTLDDVVIRDVLPTALVIRGGSLDVAVNGTTLAPAGYQAVFDVTDQGPNGGAVPAPFPSADVGPYAASSFEIDLAGAFTAPSNAPGRVLVSYDFYIPAIDATGTQTGAPGGTNQATNVGSYTGRWTGNDAEPGGRSLSDSDDVTLDLGNEAGQHPADANGTMRLQKWVGSRGDKHQTVRPGEVVTF